MIRNNVVVQETGDTFRDTVVLTVRGDGKDIPPFLIIHTYRNASYASGRRCPASETPIKGMNNDRMINYIDHISQYVEETSLLLMDRLSSHVSFSVRSHIEGKLLPNGQRMFIPLYFPSKAAFLISPLDMGANAAFKNHFYKYNRSTIQEKISAVYAGWRDVSNDALENIFTNCGIVGNEPIESLRRRFLKDVVGAVPEELEEHADFFEAWKSGAIEVEGATRGRGVTMEAAAQIPEGFLDGVYWTNYGRRVSF
jgi:hypothetical protein